MSNQNVSQYIQFPLLSRGFSELCEVLSQHFVVQKSRNSSLSKRNFSIFMLYFSLHSLPMIPLLRGEGSLAVPSSRLDLKHHRNHSCHTSNHHPHLDQTCMIHTWLQWNIVFHKSRLSLLSVCWSRDLGEPCLQLALQTSFLCMELFKFHNTVQLSIIDFLELQTISGFLYGFFIKRNVPILVNSETITIKTLHFSLEHLGHRLYEPYYFMVSLWMKKFRNDLTASSTARQEGLM